jgi:hypothetical protein
LSQSNGWYTNDNKTETFALKTFDPVSGVKEQRCSKAISKNMYKKCCFEGHCLMALLILFMFGFSQIVNSGTDFCVAFWLVLTEN